MEKVALKRALNEFLGTVDGPVISRGWSYFRDGRVSIDSASPTTQSFSVFGTEEYSVSFAIPGTSGKPSQFRAACNCPAAKPCKHQVAAAFFIIHGMDEKEISAVLHQEASPEKPYFYLQIDTKKGNLTLSGSRDQTISVAKRLQLADVRRALGGEFYRKEAEIFTGQKMHSRPFMLQILKKLPADMIRIIDEKGRELEMREIRSPILEADTYRSPQEEIFIQKGKNKVPPPVRIRAYIDERTVKKRREFPAYPFRIERKKGGKDEITFFEIEDRSLSFYTIESFPMNYDDFLRLLQRKTVTDIRLDANFPVPCGHGPYPAVEIRLDPHSDEEPVLQLRAEFRYLEHPLEKSGKRIPAAKKLTDSSELPESYTEVRDLENAFSDSRTARFPLGNPNKSQIESDVPVHSLDDEGNIARRNFDMEAAIFQSWKENGLPQNPIRMVRPVRFRSLFFDQIPAIIRMGIPVFLEAGILDLAVQKARQIVFQVGQSSGIDWFEGKLEIPGLSEKEMIMAVHAFRAKKDYIRDEKGGWINIQEIGLKKALKSVEDLGLVLAKDGTIAKISSGAFLAMEQELELRSEGLKKKTREKFRKWSQLEEKPFPVPDGFKAKLRSYQLQGAAFLLERHQAEMGGILADDMGLGKTVQTLAFLSSLQNEAKKVTGPFLVVAPMAALGVWEGEAKRFAPDLPATVWHGSSRKELNFPGKGLVITSFGVLNRDVEQLQKVKFETMIIDEAQFAKNYLSTTAKSLRSLNARSIFCLTGTPLENHATELWSLLDLILPGYVGTRRLFQARYKNPDEHVITMLRKRLSPILLRRRREEVLNELPEKTVQNLAVPMTKKQSILYDAVRQEAREFLEKAGSNYLMTMLPYLMRLRRIACHPGLDKRGRGKNPADSGKLSLLLDQLEEIETSSEGILVFSQFTDVLDLFQDILETRKKDYFRIDGSTTAKKRTDSVKKFQAGERKYFLISLKAGGSALTLHRADTVIHLDPWWNPAVEEQATARAHRMGQKRQVFVYRYISEGSVEEKVLSLQEKKRKLFRDILDHPDAEKDTKISREEILSLLAD